VTDEEDHLASVGVHNLQEVEGHHNQVQAEVVDQAVASFVVVVDVALVLGVGVDPLQDGTEASDRDPLGKLEGDLLDSGGPWDLTLALGHSFRQL